MDFSEIIYYFITGAIDSSLSPIPIIMYILVAIFAFKSYKDNKKLVLTTGLKIAIILTILSLILGGLSYVFIMDLAEKQIAFLT